MIIGGFQKLSLVDYPGKVCSVIFTHGCHFRCRYCYNPELVSGEVSREVPEQEVLDYLRAHKKMLDAISITGGEPTMQEGLRDFIGKVRELGLSVKLDTNGVNPGTIRDLIGDNLLDYIAMDLKHVWDRYGEVTQISDQDMIGRCKQTLEIIQSSDVDHEFRTTVMPGVHGKDDFLEIAGYLKPGEKYFIQDTQFDKNLDQNIDKTTKLDIIGIVDAIKVKYPELKIAQR